MCFYFLLPYTNLSAHGLEFPHKIVHAYCMRCEQRAVLCSLRNLKDNPNVAENMAKVRNGSLYTRNGKCSYRSLLAVRAFMPYQPTLLPG